MTSYFNAWLNNQNAHGQKKFVVGFIPRMTTARENYTNFLAAYPEGRVISIIREPKSWFASAQKHNPKMYSDITSAMKLWSESAAAMVRNKLDRPNSTIIVKFTDLVTLTQPLLHLLAANLGLTFCDTLLQPTFNKRPIMADSSFKVSSYGVITEPANRQQALPKADALKIDDLASGLYEDVCAEALDAQACQGQS
jgi:hypothetical protein